MTERRTIRVDVLARVEGEGALHLVVEDDAVREVRLSIYEPPRLFEAFLRGRSYRELPDLVARICGICPVAYQMSALHALESIFAVSIDPEVRALRRLYYAGEWIESHLLHMMFLAAPDYLGLDDAFAIARLHRTEVERALRLRKLGNRIIALLGGRSTSPVGACVGGFTRVPLRSELAELARDLRLALPEAEALLRWFGKLDVPSRPGDQECVALRHRGEYPMNEGRIVSTGGLDIAPAEFDQHFEEWQVPHSTALHSRIRARGPYLVGPLARVLLNAERLPAAAQAALASLAPRLAAPDPWASVFARGIEMIAAIETAIGVCEEFAPPARIPAFEPRAGVGYGVTEAPRGMLYIRVETDDRGDVQEIRIVPPTSQNQARIEEDLRALGPELLALPEDAARRLCETAIRSYDPCISCSTHFLRLSIERMTPCDCA